MSAEDWLTLADEDDDGKPCERHGSDCGMHCPPRECAVPIAISPEDRTGANGPTSLVRQQLIELLCDESGDSNRRYWESTADKILAEFIITKRG
jgi:hypothetical protein